MNTIAVTEFKQNLGHYLEKAESESFFIAKNNKVIAKLEGARRKPKCSISRLLKTVPANSQH